MGPWVRLAVVQGRGRRAGRVISVFGGEFL